MTKRTTTEDPAAGGGLLAFGLGGNVGDSEATLRWAIARLRRLFGPLKVAPLYRTAPVSAIPQPDFLNTIALAKLPKTDAPDPMEVLEQVKALERRAGRRVGERHGPRPLDIDLLLFGERVETGAGDRRDGSSDRRPWDLTLPHPGMRSRRFVLAPLADLAPDLPLPPDGALVRDLLAALGAAQRVEKVDWSLG